VGRGSSRRLGLFATISGGPGQKCCIAPEFITDSSPSVRLPGPRGGFPTYYPALAGRHSRLSPFVQPHPTPSLYRRSLHRREGVLQPEVEPVVS
jgi:hypothetical protein